MRLFQNLGISGTYRKRLVALTRGLTTFDERRSAFLRDRFGASHLLKPVLDGEPNATMTNGNDIPLQRAWAREHGMPESAALDDILLAQIEEHRTDVFYNLDPISFDSGFVKKLPASVKKSFCWRAAPSPGANFSAYDLVVCNFPGIIEYWRRQGFRSGYFTPSHDPAMDALADSSDRPVDVTFVGAYTRHHARRNQILEAAASLISEYRVVLSLDKSRLTRLAETPLGVLPGLRAHRRPAAVQRAASEPTYGVDLHRLLASSKIVLNAAIDMSGEERGNMRCFESLGCGALLVSDRGRYPKGMVDGVTIVEYDSAEQVADVLRGALRNWSRSSEIAARGRAMIRSEYSKEVQWELFQRLL